MVGNDVGGGDSSVGGSSRVSSGFGGALVRAGVPAGWAGPGGLPVIPSPRQGRHDGVRGALAGGVNHKGTTTPRKGS